MGKYEPFQELGESFQEYLLEFRHFFEDALEDCADIIIVPFQPPSILDIQAMENLFWCITALFSTLLKHRKVNSYLVLLPQLCPENKEGAKLEKAMLACYVECNREYPEIHCVFLSPDARSEEFPYGEKSCIIYDAVIHVLEYKKNKIKAATLKFKESFEAKLLAEEDPPEGNIAAIFF
jgi:hypothetical protein